MPSCVFEVCVTALRKFFFLNEHGMNVRRKKKKKKKNRKASEEDAEEERGGHVAPWYRSAEVEWGPVDAVANREVLDSHG